MIRSRRRFLWLATGGVALSSRAWAENYPARPVRLIVPMAPGTSPDAIARLFCQWLSQRLGQSFFVENRPGAGLNLATEVVVRAPADGYTILLSSLTNAVNATLYDNLSFNFIRDIVPVAFIGDNAFVMVVTPSLPAKTVPEFIAYARANPGKINMASGGNGSAPHVFGELFKEMAGVDLVHVPYRSSFYPDLFSGQVQVAFTAIAGSLAFLKDGKMHALAVTTANRSGVLPDVPAISEFVPGYEASAWLGMGAPKDTPAEIIATLNREINAIASEPEIKTRLAGLGIEPRPMTPAALSRFIASETDKWAQVAKVAHIKVD